MNTWHIATIVLLATSVANTAPLRVSFLDDESSLQDTVSVLRSNGCTEDALAGFQRAVQHYNRTPPSLDLKQFPESKSGFYEFTSGSNLVSALPHNLFNTKHEYEINCFDVALILAGDSIRTTTQPDDAGLTFVMEVNTGDNRPSPFPAGCARDAFAAVYPPQYTNLVERITGTPWTDKRIAVTPCVRSFCFLPKSPKEIELSSIVLSTRRSQWNRLGVSFPGNTALILLHRVASNRFGCFTEHAGLLVGKPGKQTYVEKTGGNGPFVRIDLNDLSDLAVYYGSLISGRMNASFPYSFLTVNDKQILEVKPQQTSPGDSSPAPERGFEPPEK